MFNLLVPFFSGLLLVAFLFAVSFFSVVCVKYACIKLAQLFPKKSSLVSTPQKAEKQPNTARKKRKPIRSIEINPEEIDRIYVKKIS